MVTFRAHKKKADIAKLSKKRDVVKLIELLDHEEQVIRFQAAWALGKLGDKRAYPHLVKLLNDPVPEVVRWAVTSLAEFGDPRAVVPMVEALAEHHSTWLGSRVEHAIREIGVQACLPHLIPLLHKPRTRDQAAKRLVDVGIPAIRPLMAMNTDHDLDLSRTRIRILGQIGSPEALRFLKQMELAPTSPLSSNLEAAVRSIETAEELMNHEHLTKARSLEKAGDLEAAAHIYEELGMGDEAQRVRALPMVARDQHPAAEVSADFFGGTSGCAKD